MQSSTISSTDRMEVYDTETLQMAIGRLQQQCDEKKELLQHQFSQVVESFKPGNLLKSAVKEVTTSPGIVQAAIETSVAVGAGVLSKKLVMGNSSSLFKKLLGGVVEFTVANGIANNAGVIAEKGIGLLKKISRRLKEDQS